MGQTLSRRHKHIKLFFANQYPSLTNPPHKACTNFKVIPFLIHISQVIQEAWDYGHNLAVDDQTIGLQGQHADKLWINFKNTGDGFQADFLCEYGYTFYFHFHNEPPPQHWIDKGFYPLHACVLGLIGCVTELHHRLGKDNLYTSVKFVKACFNHPEKVLINVVIRKGMRVITNFVTLE